MIRLIGLDLDGTVFDNEKNVSHRTAEAIRRALDAGVTVVPVTGRPYNAIPDNVFRIADFHYAAATSGAMIMDLRKKQKVHEDLISNKRAAEVLTRLKNAGYISMVFIDGQGYVEPAFLKKALACAENEIVRKYILTTRISVPDLPAYVKDRGRGVEKFTVTLPRNEAGEETGLQEALDFLAPYKKDMDIVYGPDINIEVTNKTATKGNALLFLGKLLGISREETMACGDSGNDREMLETAGLAVAMGNAEEGVKQIADFITKTNEEDGVALAIEKYVFSEAT